jgi:hypothetical protein
MRCSSTVIAAAALLGSMACGSSGSNPTIDGDPATVADGADVDPCGSSADEIGPMAGIDLSEAGSVYELDLGSGDIGARTTEGNGCVLEQLAGIGLDGAAGVRLLPPDVQLGGPDGNPGYCGIAAGANVSQGGVEVAQLNIRYALFVGSGYADALAPNNGPKAIIPYVTDAVGTEGIHSRPMAFWGLGLEHEGEWYAGVGVSEGTTASYQEPEDQGWPIGAGQDALYFGRAPDHTGAATLGTPVVGDEWIVIEHEWDLRRDHGNPDGLNRMWVWTRDGVVAGPRLDIPLTWGSDHDFAGDRVSGLDGIGYYWNRPATRVPEGHAIYSHVAFSANRPTGNPIGPPPGFLAPCDQ